MDKPFFVMCYSQNAKLAEPITETSDDVYDVPEVAFFVSEDEAREMAENQIMCQAFGYEIFCMGDGA